MPFVDDADRHEHHPGADVERAADEKVEIRLFQLELAARFEALDERMLELDLADEADAIAEAMGHEQDEAMEIDRAVVELGLREVHVHVAREPRGRGRRRGLGRDHGRRQEDCRQGRGEPAEFLIIQNIGIEHPKRARVNSGSPCQEPRQHEDHAVT